MQRRAKGEPVQYILGSWPFHPLPIELLVRPPVLIPRPETEELVDRIIKHYGNCHPRRLVDFGSGSGAIVLSLLHAFPMATAVAVDPSEDAVALTRANAERCGVENRLEVRHASSKDWASTCSKAFDLIVSNPPYIPSHEIPGLQVDVREFEDHGALDGGSDGLSVITEVLCSARQVGLPGARIYLEVHHTHPALFERFSDEARSEPTIDATQTHTTLNEQSSAVAGVPFRPVCVNGGAEVPSPSTCRPWRQWPIVTLAQCRGPRLTGHSRRPRLLTGVLADQNIKFLCQSGQQTSVPLFGDLHPARQITHSL